MMMSESQLHPKLRIHFANAVILVKAQESPGRTQCRFSRLPNFSILDKADMARSNWERM
jgi:hypothetical protein